MSQTLYSIIGLSCIIPAIIGIYLYRRMDKSFHPFVWMALLTLIPELLHRGALNNAGFVKPWLVSINLYMLLNFTCYLLLVYKGGYLKRKAVYIFFGGAIAVGVVNFLYNASNQSAFSPLLYLLCYVSTIMLFTAIDILSGQVLAVRVKLINNFWFWFSSTVIIYNAFNLLIFGSYVFAMSATPTGKAIGNIQHFANLACQLLFAVAMINTVNRHYKKII